MCKLFNVEHGAARVGDGFAEQSLGVGTESLLNLLLAGLGADEGTLDAQLLQCDAKEVERAAIDFIRGDNVVTCLADIEDGIEVGGLTTGSEHSTNAAFECGNLGCYGIIGGILQTSIKIAFFLQVKQFCHLVGVIVLERCRLDDGQLYGFSVLGLVAGLHAERALS